MAEEEKEAPERASDIPLDLTRERETFVRSFLRKGVELTEELLEENASLRSRLAAREQENLELRAQVASDDAIRDLLQRIEGLEHEKKRLSAHSQTLAEAQQSVRHRYAEIENELNDLANLYIAAFQLHSSLSLRRVVRHLLDMIGQLIGAQAFIVYVVDGEAGEARPLAQENVDLEIPAVGLGEGAVGEACLTGLSRIPEHFPSELPARGSIDEPFALVPLVAVGKPVGVIAIVSMLEQKQTWAKVDHELLHLLSVHAGPALIAANLYTQNTTPVSALGGLVENYRRRGSETPSAADMEL